MYAVGGVRSDDSPLGNARLDAMPPRVAYGEIGGAPSWEPGRYTAFYTGSSVATAVVSSIAAVVWDSFPDLTPDELMKTLYESGKSFVSVVPANFWFGSDALSPPQPPPVHRLSLCTALQRAREKYSPGRYPPLACVPWTPTNPASSSISSSGKTCYPMAPSPAGRPSLHELQRGFSKTK